MLSRRHFLQIIAGLSGLHGVTTAIKSAAVAHNLNSSLFLTAADTPTGEHLVVGFNMQGQVVMRLPVAQRGHGLAIQPNTTRAVLCARRPNTEAVVFNYHTGEKIQIIQSKTHRHFFGHGCFSLDGQKLFMTEHDFIKSMGVIGVYEGNQFERIGEFPAYGIDSHELKLLADGKTLVIANGGIATHPDSGRKKLNIGSMLPSLAYVDSETGNLLEKQILSEKTLSIRHLAIWNQYVGMALQEEGEENLPLLAVHKSRVNAHTFDLTENVHEADYLPIAEDILQQLQGYTASIAVAARAEILAVTSPRGNIVLFWGIKTAEILKILPLRDTAGIAVTSDEQFFVITAGTGEMVWVRTTDLTVQQRMQQPDIYWDNHLVAV